MMFIKTNDDIVKYKCDTFWTTSTNIRHAKVYSSDSNSQVNSCLESYDYIIEKQLKSNPDKLDEIVKNYNNCKLGYRIIETNNDNWCENDIGELRYTHQIIMSDFDNPTIIDIRRNQRIDELLNKNIK